MKLVLADATGLCQLAVWCLNQFWLLVSRLRDLPEVEKRGWVGCFLGVDIVESAGSEELVEGYQRFRELETAMGEKVPFVVLVWVDEAYGLIKWKMEMELGRSSHIAFTNPDFVKYAESFGAKGYRIKSAEELLPTLKKALADDTVSVIACPVDYSENIKLTDKLGVLTQPI